MRGGPAKYRAIAGVLALATCVPAPVRPPDDEGGPEAVPEAQGMHRETRYGWSLLLPDGCSEFSEERFEGQVVGRAVWVCPGLTIALDATPFADPLSHSARARFADGADLCAATMARDVQEVERSADAPIAAIAYWELIPQQAMAVHRRDGDRRASLFVYGMYGDCPPTERVVRSLRPEGPPLAGPPGELRAPTLAFPSPSPDCHRHYSSPTCTGAPPFQVLHCGDLRVEWRQLDPELHGLVAAKFTKESPAGRAGAWSYVHGVTGPTADGPGGPAWRVLLPTGEVGVWAPLAREREVLDLLARLRVASDAPAPTGDE